ncbi:protein of unknown function [Mycolicibacterium fluoranthenivorans]|uniref:DUF4190 domain-containing protein n=2 Tax=Mycolicibacterium fluoranthenivorans TaxID=258505 RepID=A0A1G4WY37_9MYCO|nr:protein of unknown function [Mycolicibacterium fluoranthenivorans]
MRQHREDQHIRYVVGMTVPGQDAGATASSGASETTPDSSSATEPQSGAYEAPPLEWAPEPVPPPAAPDYPGYGPPAGYGPPPSYQPPSQQPPSYEQPLYPPQGYAAPPTYQPGGYPPPPPGFGAPYPDPSGYGAPGYPGAQYGTPPPPPYGAAPGYPPAGYGAPYGAPATETNPLAIGSLVASAIGVLCGIGSIIGIVLGIVALNQIKQTRQGGQGLAIAGIAVGAVSLVVSMIFAVTLF